jgi:hypothetical protein
MKPPPLSLAALVASSFSVLDLVREIGPGEVDEPRFVIAHGSVTTRLKPGRTFRAWVGFYPLPQDRTRAK